MIIDLATDRTDQQPAAETPAKSYYLERMDQLGVTEETNKVKLWHYNAELQENELQDVPVFREDPEGIKILLYSLDRRKVIYAKEGSRHRINDYYVTRYAEPKVKKDGSLQKYSFPPKQQTRPFFPPLLLEAFDQKRTIPVLYLTEGYFKAWRAAASGIYCIGLPSITCMKEKETGAIHEDIKRLLLDCNVERCVWLTDGDCRDITTKEITEDADLRRRPQQFFQTVGTFYELLSSFENVQRYFAHINSEHLPGNPKGLDDLLCAFPEQEAQILAELHSFDRVTTGIYHGEYITKINITFNLGTVQKYFLLHDVDVFYLHHLDRRPDLKGKDFKWGGTLYHYNETTCKCEIQIPSDASNYFRVGDKYYEHLQIPNKYNQLTKTFHRREKETIADDNGKDIFKHIPKYKAFCNVPDHVNYQRVIYNCFNIYSPFEHEISDGECELTLDFIKHIFGADLVTISDNPGESREVPRWELGLDYLTLLFKKPQQILPILCLVSFERQTGKTTFAKWLNLIFTENMAVVGNEDLANPFNSHWATKLLICCDETKIDKHTVIERVKSLSTSSAIMMNAKGRDQVSLEFFGKFIFLSNNEDNFINIDDQEIRFWVIKVPVITSNNVDMLEDLKDEIPAFLNYLNKRQMVTAHRERHWFDTRYLKTEALQKIVNNSRPNIEKQLRLAIEELFEATDLKEITMPLDAITRELLDKKGSDKDYVKRILHKLGYKTAPVPARVSWPRIQEQHTTEGITFKVESASRVCRYYSFKRSDFEDQPIQPGSSMLEPNSEELPF